MTGGCWYFVNGRSRSHEKQNMLPGRCVSGGKEALPAHCLIGPESGLRLPSVILLEQLRTIDKCRLRVHLGRLGEKQLLAINAAIAISLGLRGSYE